MIRRDCILEAATVKAVILALYKIVTLDEHDRGVPHEAQDADAWQRLNWKRNIDVTFDANFKVFLKLLEKGRLFKPADTWVRWGSMLYILPVNVLLHAPKRADD